MRRKTPTKIDRLMTALTESPTARARDLRVKKSPELLAEILQTIRDGQPITRAARLCGVNPDSVHRWRQEDPDFNEAVTK
jgi:transposase-like protein